MKIGRYIIHPASYLRKKLVQALILKYTNGYFNDQAFWYVMGAYQSRRFGICIYRDESNNDAIFDEIAKQAKELRNAA